MPPKRRLSGDDVEEGGEKKRKKLEEPQQIQAVMKFVCKFKKEDGNPLCELVLKLPNKRSEPGFYETVENPIDIQKIQQKMKAEEYPTMTEFKADFELLFTNTKTYYAGRNEHKEAVQLENLFNKAVAAVQNGEELTLALGLEDEDKDNITEFLEEYLGVVMTAVDSTDPERSLSTVFQLLPSKRRYPEYYKVTSAPMDLKNIAMKIQGNKYTTIAEMEEDLQLMLRNATSFNEPGSQIYKDAKVISKLVKSKKLELDASLKAKQNRGAKSSRRQSRQVYSVTLSQLQYEDSESENDDDDEDLIPKDDPLWDLFQAVRTYTTSGGVELSEAFLSLPSKRELPDYYQTIAEPISLNQIKRRLKLGEYRKSLAEMSRDMDKMFENCKNYNRADSKLYKDAAKLQRVMKSKLEELEDDVEVVPILEEVRKPVTQSPKDPREQLRKRMKSLYNTILYYTNTDNIQPIGVFMELPDKKAYPDYYDIINDPVDMKMINDKVMTNTYRTEEEMLQDCKLMFSNCRLYNEEGSAIYEDANILERVLMKKAIEMGIITNNLKQQTVKKSRSVIHKIKLLYDSLKDYRDNKGRQLSLIFLKLPSKHDYPDYYDIIKRPIDMEKISARIRANGYETMEDAVADFTLVFDNACKYNEPDSQIYKDAQSLQRLAHQTVRHLTEDDGVPDARAAVQDIFSNIYHTIFTAQDAEERCYVDSFTELPEHDEIAGGKKSRALSLEIIKRRVDRGLYRRLDLLQRDIFIVFARARKLSRADSQTFEDAVELQKIFIKARDQYGENGKRIVSTAYAYTADHLEAELVAVRASKANEGPAPAADEDVKMEESSAAGGTKDWSGENDADKTQYHVGDFVYVMPEENAFEPHIYHVERLFEKDGAKTIWARQFFRQRETFHVPTRTFFEKEVMQGDLHNAIPITKVMGKCFVMALKDYIKYKPETFEEKDIYVCEWRYTSKIRNWKKIKPSSYWDTPAHITIVQREKPLEPKKVASVFKDRIEKHKEEVEEIEALEKIVEEEVPRNIKWSQAPDEKGTYWEQYTIPGPITVRRGDHVLVRGEGNRNMVAQIDTMWTGADGMANFNGPWFVVPQELPPQPDRKYYRAEAFLSTISDSNPLLSVVGRCVVQDFADYCRFRPTQYNETDVYVCESMYDEAKRQIRPLPNGLKKYKLSGQAYRDEIYNFRSVLTPEKESLAVPLPVPAALQPVVVPSPATFIDEDSLDAPPSIGSQESASPAVSQNRTKTPGRKKLVTAYILFSADVRRIAMEENPGVKFGEISRIVAERWRAMAESDKVMYGERAKKYNEEKEQEEQRKEEEKKRQAELAARALPPPASSPGLHNPGSPAGGGRSRSDSGQRGGGGDPLFHVVPPKPQRLLHSEAYIKYIEGLSRETKTMCNWDKQLSATNTITRVADENKLPASWLQGGTGEHTTSTEALWALRDFMMHEALGVVKIM